MTDGQRYIDPEFRRKFNAQPCPICGSIEGCDHPMHERLRAAEDTAYRDQMRADDPLWRRHDINRKPTPEGK